MISLALAAMLCTHPELDCSGFPDRPMYRWLIRRRPITEAAWRDTIRWTPRAGEGPGSPVLLPCPVPTPGRLWLFQVAGVDSAGNVACEWSNLAWKWRAQ